MDGKKTLNSSLLAQLDLALTNHLASKLTPPRIAILGIGNELNGDDSAGLLVVRALKNIIGKNEQVMVVEGSIAPENFGAPIRRFQPDWVWLIDAAEMGVEPGAIQIIGPAEIGGVSAFSHALPLSMFSQFLIAETAAIITFIGIQPMIVESFTEVSELVSNSAKSLGIQLANWLTRRVLIP